MYRYGYHMMDGYPGYSNFPVASILFWAVLIGAAVLLIYLIMNKRRDRMDNLGEDEAMQILKRRYAKGEISKKEFQDMKKDIE